MIHPNPEIRARFALAGCSFPCRPKSIEKSPALPGTFHIGIIRSELHRSAPFLSCFFPDLFLTTLHRIKSLRTFRYFSTVFFYQHLYVIFIHS